MLKARVIHYSPAFTPRRCPARRTVQRRSAVAKDLTGNHHGIRADVGLSHRGSLPGDAYPEKQDEKG